MFEFVEKPTQHDIFQKKFNRLMDIKDKTLKLHSDDLMELAIKGVC